MPRGDGTGPRGQGPGTGRGMGGRDNPSGRFAQGAGPGGECVCPSCGTVQVHRPGQPCNEIKCPKCGTMMVRK